MAFTQDLRISHQGGDGDPPQLFIYQSKEKGI